MSATTNQITSSPETYDASGNMTNDGSNTITYDAENRPVTVSGGSSTYIYDGNGLRVKKTASGTPTVYIFSGSKVIAEYVNGNGPSSPQTEYIYGGATLLASIGSSGTLYFHQDQLSNRMITNSSGSVYSKLGHFPFGEQWYDSTYTKWYFTSYEFDNESGNHRAAFRSYVNRLGRFSAPDPLGGDSSDPQSYNRYTFVLNGPCNLIDELGLDGCTFTIKFVNNAGLSPGNVEEIEDYIKSIFAASSALQPNSVDVNFVTSGQSNFTLIYNNEGVPGSPDEGVGKPGVNVGIVYANLEPSRTGTLNGIPNGYYTDRSLAVLGAHEMGHGLGGFPDVPFSPNAGSTLMSIDTDPNWKKPTNNILVNNFPFGLLFTPGQVAALYSNKNCKESGGGASFFNPLKFCLYFPWMCNSTPRE